MKNIFIIRHGQSEANANVRGLLSSEKKYVIDSDFAITEMGKEQTRKTAKKIADIIQQEESEKTFNIYLSPYKRTRMTANVLIKEVLSNNGFSVLKLIEDPRLVEQDFGDFDYQYRNVWEQISPHSFKINQAKFHDDAGRFFARLENGENLLDVYNRVSLFVTTRLERDLKQDNTQNHIIVTHGNTMRIMRMFMTNLQIEKYVQMCLPNNAGGYHLKYNENDGTYHFVDEF